MAKYPLQRNQVDIVGNLTGDPESVITPSGKNLTKVTVAVNQGHFDRNTNEWVDDFTAYYDVPLWEDDRNSGAAFAKEYLRKGDRVFVTGTIKPRAYINKAGEAVPANEIIFARIDGLTSTALRGARTEEAPRRANAPVAVAAADDDGEF
jgi:single stranded DNA-binding protein